MILWLEGGMVGLVDGWIVGWLLFMREIAGLLGVVRMGRLEGGLTG
jgi:hypothetical protein